MNVIIIEDEPIAAKKLKVLVETLRPSWNIMALIDSVKQAINFLETEKPELIFLDIHLADGKSFEIFDHVKVTAPIIFTTAYDQYALQAFEQNSIDYLLKPITKKNLERGLQKFEQWKPEPLDYTALLSALKEHKKEYQKRFMVHSGQKIKTIPVEEVAYFFSESKQTFLVTKTGNQYLIDQTLDSIEETLNPELFFRINRGFIVSIESIAEMEPYTKSRVYLKLYPNAPKETIVSVERSKFFKKWLNQ